MEETALRALTKLQQVLPPRLARRVDALQSHTLRVSGQRRGPQVDGAVLAQIAAAARDREILRFRYSDHSGSGTRAPGGAVPPGQLGAALVPGGLRPRARRLAHLPGRPDRRAPAPVGHRFTLRPLPADDIAAYVAARTRQVQMKVTGRVIVHAAGRPRSRRGWAAGAAASSRWDPVAAWSSWAAGPSRTSPSGWACWTPTSRCIDSPELAAAVQRVADRYARAVS